MLQAAICYFINGLYFTGMSNINVVMIVVVRYTIRIGRSCVPVKEIRKTFVGDYSLYWK